MSNKDKLIEPRINDEIQGYSKVRIVGEGLESKEVTLDEARRIASDMGLDLVEINNKIPVPILKIIDYSKYLFELKKSMKNKSKKVPSLKEIQLTANISNNDLMTKVRKAKEFISDGHKVKLTITMKGRELTRREESKKSFYSFIVEMEDVSIPEGQIKDEGNKCSVILKKK